jgi:hypothetical protein
MIVCPNHVGPSPQAFEVVGELIKSFAATSPVDIWCVDICRRLTLNHSP